MPGKRVGRNSARCAFDRFRRTWIAIAAALATVGAVQGQSSQLNGKNCLTAGCHSDLSTPRHVHAPVSSEQCSACHRETDKTNHKFAPVAPQPEMCLTCHKDVQTAMSGANVRSGHQKTLVQQNCTTCHDPHGSGHSMLLKHDGGAAMCQSCHSKDVPLAGFVHSPIEQQGCLDCHNGHRSEYVSLLSRPYADVCIQCHEEIQEIVEDSPYVHSPAGLLQCVACHSPHASVHDSLLLKAYASATYVPVAGLEAYQLCFECHDPGLADEPKTNEATAFRNGDVNLHFLHVSKERKGRNCRICHAPHAADQPRLIRSNVSFGDWKSKLRFVLSPTGGYCATACHPAKRYDREVPVDWNVEPVEPQSGAGGSR